MDQVLTDRTVRTIQTGLRLFFVGAGVGTLALNLYVAARANRRYDSLPELPIKRESVDPLSVTVIVPARNEAAIIARVVDSLKLLDPPAARIIVVDDSSTDETGTIARAHGAEVLTLSGDPPVGWTGKCNACDQAARLVTTEWLLFTDADTSHLPHSLGSAIRYADVHGLDALSLLLQQECYTVWERAALPLAYQNFFAALPEDTPTFNGQYILIRRSVYEESAGFGAVRDRVMEDVALAGHLARCGYRTALVNGHNAASVRMYQDLAALVRGMTKTSFTAARDRGLGGFVLALPFFLGVFFTPGLLFAAVRRDLSLALLWIVNYAVSAVSVRAWMHRFEVPTRYSAAVPVGIALLWYTGFISTFRHLFGRGVRWKDRRIST